VTQQRFHVVQAIDRGAQLRLIAFARCLSTCDPDTKIHLHLSMFLGDDGLTDGRGFLWNAVSLS